MKLEAAHQPIPIARIHKQGKAAERIERVALGSAITDR